jgi:protein-tyrosine phosphatase
MPTNITILVVGGANTGRSPMAAALLRRILEEHNKAHPQNRLHCTIESAGVIGYDGDPAEPEAYNAMLQFELDISSHRARSLTPDIAKHAGIILAIDSGIVHVIRGQYPTVLERTVTIASLAGRQREIPDLSNMLLGAWIGYAHEIDDMLRQGLPGLIAHIEAAQRKMRDPERKTDPQAHRALPTAASAPPPSDEAANQLATPSRSTPVNRCLRLLDVVQDMPDLISWDNARSQIETEIKTLAEQSYPPDDYIPTYLNILLAMLKLATSPPTPHQMTILSTAIQTIRTPIDQQTLNNLSLTLATWQQPTQ